MGRQETTSGTALGLLLVAGGVALFLCSGAGWLGLQFSSLRSEEAPQDLQQEVPEQASREQMDKMIVEQMLETGELGTPTAPVTDAPPPATPITSVGGEMVILGSLDRSLVDAVIKRNMAQIRYCYQRELTKNPSLAGKITIKFVIAKDGSVSQATTKTSTMDNTVVESCIAGRVQKMTFPEPEPGSGVVIVTYPFLFSPS